MKTIKLVDGGLLIYDEVFLPPNVADSYFVGLRDQCVWEQKPGVFGQSTPTNGFLRRRGRHLSLLGHGERGAALDRRHVGDQEKIESVPGEYNYCLLNRYRSGSDSMGWHADNEPEMGT